MSCGNFENYRYKNSMKIKHYFQKATRSKADLYR